MESKKLIKLKRQDLSLWIHFGKTLTDFILITQPRLISKIRYQNHNPNLKQNKSHKNRTKTLQRIIFKIYRLYIAEQSQLNNLKKFTRINTVIKNKKYFSNINNSMNILNYFEIINTKERLSLKYKEIISNT